MPLLFNLFGLLVLISYCSYEYFRWIRVGIECDYNWVKNSNLKNSDTCKQPELFSEEQQRLCNKAKLELNDFKRVQCNMAHFWDQGWINQLCQIFVNNHWLLFGTVVLPICFIVYKCFESCQQIREEQRQEKMFDKLVAMVPKNLALPPGPGPGTGPGQSLVPGFEKAKKRKLYISGEIK